jgi:hypothetical protein
MTVETQTNYVIYTGNGVTTQFPYTFRIPEMDMAQVFLLDATTNSIIRQLNNGEFSITGVSINNYDGGEVTYPLIGSPITSTVKLLIQREAAYTQGLDLENQGGFYPESVEYQLDKLVFQIQQLVRNVDRSLKTPLGVTLPKDHFPISDGTGGVKDGGDATNVDSALADLFEFREQYLGAYASDPSTDANGNPIQQGAFYWNTASKVHRYWDGDSWETFPFATVADGAITRAKLADDLTDTWLANRVRVIRQVGVRERVYFVGSTHTEAVTDHTSGGASGRTLVHGHRSRGAQQDALIRQVKMNVTADGGGAGAFKVKHLRPIGSTFSIVGETGLISVGVGTGVKTFELATPLGPLLQTDRIGIFMNATSPAWTIGNAVVSGVSNLYFDGDAVGGETYSSVDGFDLEYQGLCSTPVLATFGDSLIAGHNGGAGHRWYPPQDVDEVGQRGPWGERDSEPAYIIAQAIPGLDYQNFGVGGYTWSDVLSMTGNIYGAGDFPKSRVIVIHCGINDIQNGRTWSQVESDMYACLNRLAGAEHVFINEILPWTGNDAEAATIRDWNARYALWCEANGAKLVKMHDAMGVVRPSTGYLDDQKYGVPGDGHLTKEGVAVMAGLIVEAMKEALA